jgi:hypothetical protein
MRRECRLFRNAASRLAIAWKPQRLRECGNMLHVVASLQAVLATRAAEWLQWKGRVGNQIENLV